MFNHKYLSQKHLKGFSKYKYSAIDTSPLSQHVMHPTWNTLVKIIPKWIAPNLITFVGFLCMVAVVVLLHIYDYNLGKASGLPGQHNVGGEYAVPNWIYTLSGVLIFVAYNLDGIDGKQARRIGVSGPLGELFDHGIDSYVVFFIPYCIMSIFGRDQEYSLPCYRGYLIILNVVVNFYASHCEKYNTGTLYLPWAYDVSMWMASIIFVVAGVRGPGLFKFYVLGNITFVQVFEVAAHLIGLLTTFPIAIYNVHLSYKNRTGKMYPLLEAIRPIWSLLSVTVVMSAWVFTSPGDVIERDPRAVIFLFGTLFSNIATRLIIAEMSHQRCELFSWYLWPLIVGVGVSLYEPQLEMAILYSLLAICIFSHLHYGICVVRQLCDYFKISCFSVPKDRKK